MFGPLFASYNGTHRYSGLAMLTPHDVHSDLAQQRVAQRVRVLAAAYAAHPERFPRGMPMPGTLPTAVSINKPLAPAEVAHTDLAGCSRIDDLEAPRDNSTPEPGPTSSMVEEMMLVGAH